MAVAEWPDFYMNARTVTTSKPAAGAFVPAPIPDNEADRLLKLASFGVMDTPAEPDYDDFTHLASRLLRTPIALISLVDESRQWFKSRVGLDAVSTSRDISFCGHALLGQELFVVEDACADARFADNPLVTGSPFIRFYAGCPLITSDGFVLGTLCVIDTQPRQLHSDEADTLRKLGRQLVNLLEQRRINIEHLKTLEKLRQREIELSRFALVAERTDNVLIMCDPDGLTTWVNPAFERVTGYTLQEVVGRKPGALLQFEGTSPVAKATLSEAVRLRKGARTRILNRGKAGNVYWMDVDLQPLIADSGDFVGFVAIETDITELIRGRENLEALLQSMPVGLTLQDTSGHLVKVNLAARKMLQDGSSEPIVHLPWELAQLAQDTLALKQIHSQTTVPVKTGSDTTRWMEVSTALLPGAFGEPDGVLTAFLDQTERIQAGRYIELASITADIGYWTWSLEGDRLELSDSWARGLGLKTNVVSTKWFTHPEDQPNARGAIQDVLRAKRKTFKFEERIRSGNGEWRWALCGGAATEWDSTGRVVRLAGIYLDIDDRKRAEEAQQRAATTDPLTGLPNRLVLHDRLERALLSARRHERCGALLFMDLDHFKRVNDSYGHSVGDLLLSKVSSLLIRQLRSEDTLARIGGDELVVLLPELEGDMQAAMQQAQGVAHKLLKALDAPIDVRGIELKAGASIGITLFPKTKDESCDDLLREADTAMYGAKSETRGTVKVYEATMHQTISSRLQLENDLRHALRRDGLELYVQGKWTADRQLVGGEALLRWTHPNRGQVSPAEFVPVAEDSELIVPLGRWVLERACDIVRSIREERPDFVLSVNLSPKQFRATSFVADLRSIVAAAGMTPAALMLEITEGVLLQPELAAQLLSLSDEGYQFSLDDFGTGYSSLAYLKRLPVDELKIDRSFIRDIHTDVNDAALVQAILFIARRFHIKTVAEGVESHKQLTWLASHGCELLQGYLFDQPSPVDRFCKFL